MTRAAACGALLVAAAIAGSCANMQSPPGGPPDALPPVLVKTTPDSATITAKPDRVVFQFNEIVAERPAGATTLAGLFLVSPRDGEPRVEWKRDRLTVRPRKRWRANTVYTVTMLPGVADLRGNVRKEGATVLFSTGGAIPNTRLEGALFDWPTGRGAVGAMVQAIVRSDTTIQYVAVTDSTGGFSIAHLPAGSYLLRGVIDLNHNRTLDRREPWDTVPLVLADSARSELLAFVHDTIGPTIGTVTVVDSMTVRLTFNQPLDPAQPIEARRFALRSLPDSGLVPIVAAQSARAWDSAARLRAAARSDSAARRDTTARPRRDSTARRDTVGLFGATRPDVRRGARFDSSRADTTRKPSRPSPQTDVVLTLGARLLPAHSYRVHVDSARNLLHIAQSSDRGFSLPKPPPADTTKRDSTRARAPGAPPGAAPPGTIPRGDSLPRGTTPGGPPAQLPPVPPTTKPPADTVRRPPPVADRARRGARQA